MGAKSIYVDLRWITQNGQGVVTYLAGLHSELPKSRYRFLYGITHHSVISDFAFLNKENTIVIGDKGLLWRLFWYPIWLAFNNFDAAHFQYMCPIYKLKTRYIVTLHDILFEEHPYYFSFYYRLARKVLFRWSALIADLLITVSDFSKESIERIYGASNVRVIYNSVNSNFLTLSHSKRLSTISKAAYQIDQNYVLTVGRLEARKNYITLAESFRASKFFLNGYKLVLVGWSSKDGLEIKSKLQEYDFIIHLEHVSDSELYSVYANSSAFVYPSIFEGFGIPVLEAMHFNLPIIVSNTYPISEISSACFATFSPLNSEDITNKLDNLYTKGMVPVNYKTVLDNFTWAKSAVHYCGYISDMFNE